VLVCLQICGRKGEREKGGIERERDKGSAKERRIGEDIKRKK
jgi:hypothetical protein